MNSNVTLLAVTDETNTCECCGKTDLKRVAVLQLTDGSVVRYGRDCAARKLGNKVAKDIDNKIDSMNTIEKIKSIIIENKDKYSEKVIANHINVKFAYNVWINKNVNNPVCNNRWFIQDGNMPHALFKRSEGL